MPQILLAIAIVFMAISPNFAGITRLDINKLVFGNGGGFLDRTDYMELLSIKDDGSYFSKTLDLGASDYIENVPDRVTVFPHIIPDTIEFNSLDFREAGPTNSFTLGGSLTGSWPGSQLATLGDRPTLVVGDLARHFLSLKGNSIDAWTILPGSVGVSPNVFKESKLLFQTDETLPGDMIFGRFNNKPVLVYRGSVFIEGSSNAEKRLGILADSPPEVFFVDGDLRITNGQINGSAGIFKGADFVAVTDTYTEGPYWRMIAHSSISIKYVNHSVIAMAIATFKHYYGGSTSRQGWGGAGMKIIIRDDDDGPVPASEPAHVLNDGHSPNPSEIQFDGSYSQQFYNLGTSWSGDLKASPTLGDTRTYTFELHMQDYQFAANPAYNKLTNSNAYETNIVVLGLPSAPLPSAIAATSLDTNILDIPNSSIINPDSGNYLEKNLVVFKNGGYIADGSGSVVIRSSNGFKHFKATKLIAANVYRMSVLEAITNRFGDDLTAVASAASRYSLFVGGKWGSSSLDGGTNNNDSNVLGFSVSGLANPMIYDSKNVTFNIQSWAPGTGYVDNPSSANNVGPLKILTPMYVGEEGLTVSPAEGGSKPKVAINMPLPAHTDINSENTLFVNGNVAFTGTYVGQYGSMYYEETTNASTLDQKITGLSPGTWSFLIITNGGMNTSVNDEFGIRTRLTYPAGGPSPYTESKSSVFSFDSSNSNYGFVSMYYEDVDVSDKSDIFYAGVRADKTCYSLSVSVLILPKKNQVSE
jgi:hypothetical protein